MDEFFSFGKLREAHSRGRGPDSRPSIASSLSRRLAGFGRNCYRAQPTVAWTKGGKGTHRCSVQSTWCQRRSRSCTSSTQWKHRSPSCSWISMARHLLCFNGTVASELFHLPPTTESCQRPREDATRQCGQRLLCQTLGHRINARRP